MTLGKCKGCGAVIVWTQTAAGKWIPLDEQPRPDGNYVVQSGVAIALKAGDMKLITSSDRYFSHFVTCPVAASFKNGRRDA